MENKGLFDLMFMLVMLVLLLPAATHHTAIVTSDTQSQVNDFALLTDAAIADALADTTFNSPCSQAISANYDSNIRAYLAVLKTDYRAAGNNCDYNLFTPAFASPVYSGTINVYCSKDNNSTSTFIEKKLIFNKTISVVGTGASGTYCKVIVKDNLSVDYNQVDYNKII